jgi:hypothetical protein
MFIELADHSGDQRDEATEAEPHKICLPGDRPDFLWVQS